MIELLTVEWVKMDCFADPEHMTLVRELMSYHVLCSESCLLDVDSAIGDIRERHPNSALHWSRVYEWPWVIRNLDLDGKGSVLDVGGGHAVLQYAVAKRCGWLYNLDPSETSRAAVARMVERLKLNN